MGRSIAEALAEFVNYLDDALVKDVGGGVRLNVEQPVPESPAHFSTGTDKVTMPNPKQPSPSRSLFP
jgi:hypothetical protein